MLEIGLPNDPRVAMRAASIVPGQKRVQPKNADPAPSQLSQARAPEPAYAEHNDVESITHIQRSAMSKIQDEQ